LSDIRDDWDDWLDRHGSAILLLARQWCLTLSDAEDAVQEGFVRFWRSRERVKDPHAYLFACIRSSAHDQARSARSRRDRENRAGRQQLREQSDRLFEPAVERDERRRAIERAISQLPREQAEVLTMKIWGGLTFVQIAEAMSTSPNTAASRYRYALAALRDSIKEESM
jgi:RNA polymerase sigma-70 factor (ECF subfamily)